MKNKYIVVEKELTGEIMSTDTFIKIISDKHKKTVIQKSIDNALIDMKTFAKKFSRFVTNNELFDFNNSGLAIKVSKDLYKILALSKDFYNKTNHMFDIGILPYLQEEGYVKGKKEGFIDFSFKPKSQPVNSTVEHIQLLKNNTVFKPKDVQVDLGGIGKGYIVDKIAEDLSKDYRDFMVDAGGDMYCSGVDISNDNDCWAINVEHPKDPKKSVAMLVLKDKGVATSGVNQRKWILDGKEKNHIIDPRTQKSVENGLLTVTVVSPTTLEADIMAKSLLIMGLSEGMEYAKDNKIASLFIDKKVNLYKSPVMEEYVWKN